MHNMEKCGRGKRRPQGGSLRSHRRPRLAPLPPPLSPAPMLRHVVYASLLHFGVESAAHFPDYMPGIERRRQFIKDDEFWFKVDRSITQQTNPGKCRAKDFFAPCPSHCAADPRRRSRALAI